MKPCPPKRANTRLLLVLGLFLALFNGTSTEAQQQLQHGQEVAQKRSAPARPQATAEADLAKRLGELEEEIAILRDSTVDNPLALQKNINTVWLIVAAALVFFMQAGFAMLEIGFSRAKNTINIVMKNLMDFSVASICYLFFGFAIMFGASESGWFGSSFSALWNVSADSALWPFWMFQVVFAATAATIASGAMAERTKFIGYLFYTVLLSGLIYPIYGHWAWGGAASGLEPGFGESVGWLARLGFHDFAGSTVVHGIGGAAALAGIIVLGPRIDKFTKDGQAKLIPGHNIPLAALGTLILWFGWFGFNAGSTFQGDASLGRICATTIISASTASVVGMFLFWAVQGSPNVAIAMYGALGGLVAITAGADVITPFAAVAVGAVAGCLSTLGAMFLDRLRIDDVVGAVPVHLFNGIWGTVCVALFSDSAKLGTQLLGTVSICGSAFLIALIVFKLIDMTVGLRASDEDQEDGLDFSEHSANAYPDFKTTER